MKINCENKEYIREENMITCRIQYSLNLAKDIDGSINPLIIQSICFAKGLDTIIPIVVEGVAKCNPEDTFDEVLGKRIAESRAKAKFGKVLYNSLNKLQEAINSVQISILKNREKVDIFKRQELSHVEDLINEAYR